MRPFIRFGDQPTHSAFQGRCLRCLKDIYNTHLPILTFALYPELKLRDAHQNITMSADEVSVAEPMW